VLAVAVALALATLPCRSARAELTVGADLDAAIPLDEPAIDAGWGVGGRIGPRLDAKVLTLGGELAGHYYSFGGDLEPSVYRGMLGARLGVGVVVRAIAFVHGGLARATFTEPAGTGVDFDRTALAYDAGLGAEFVLLPLLNLGAHGAYNSVAGDDDSDALDWLTLGVHAELVF
jgi:opacity protein-like surface antigen